jgi:hypothetical protein
MAGRACARWVPAFQEWLASAASAVGAVANPSSPPQKKDSCRKRHLRRYYKPILLLPEDSNNVRLITDRQKGTKFYQG